MTVVPSPVVLFRQLEFQVGTEAGARAVFQSFVTDLVAVRHPTANEVAGPGGRDWGIDTYVGRLDESVVVWQSKFFLTWTGEDQRKQVRESFTQVREKAKEEGFHLDAWTLCVPCVLAPGEQKWFDDWATRQNRAHGVRVDLWNGVELRRQLMKPDAVDVYRAYFGGDRAERTTEPVQIMEDVTGLGDALFVRQLEEADQVETDAARGLFFAAEALARDLAAGGNRTKVAALKELHLEVQSLWETQFNARVSAADTNGRMPGLVEDVLRDAAHCPDPEGLRLRPAHRKGIAHRLVEDARAGWVRHWRDIVPTHKGRRASETVAMHLAAGQLGSAS